MTTARLRATGGPIHRATPDARRAAPKATARPSKTTCATRAANRQPGLKSLSFPQTTGKGRSDLKLATWNVNSIAARLPLVLRWIAEAQPDVLCMQEIKCTDDRFPADEFAALGYESTVYGQRTYNGVAILSRARCSDVRRGFPDDGADAHARLLAGTVGGVHVGNVYSPNG